MNILITSASKKVSLIKWFKMAQRLPGGGEIIACDISPQSIALYFADEFRIIPKSDDPNFIPFLVDLCNEKNIKLLIPTRDGELKNISENKGLFEEKCNCKVMVAEPKTIDTCLNKYSFYHFCNENKLPTPSTVMVDPKIDKAVDIIKRSLSFPVFIKPKVGFASKNTFIANDANRLELFLKLNSEEEFIAQEYIDNTEYTIDLFSDFEGNVISVIPRERVETESGESYIGRTEVNNTIIKETINLSGKLNLIGHNTIQCFYDDENDKVIFIEVNPRYGGGAPLGFSAGAFTPEYLIKIINGSKLQPKLGDFKNNLFMFRFSDDVFLNKSNGIFYKEYNSKKIFCIDIDGTICSENCEYSEAKPFISVINKINRLYDLGHHIHLFTSRGAKSNYNWIPLTKKQLKDWRVKYHKISQGKPFADYYVDNKSIDILDWI